MKSIAVASAESCLFVEIKSTRLFARPCGIPRSSRISFDQFARAVLERFPVEFKFASVHIRYEETARVAPGCTPSTFHPSAAIRTPSRAKKLFQDPG